MNLINKIKDLASQHHLENVGFRNHLHQYPELSFEETETAKFIIEKIKLLNIPIQTGLAGNGIVALIEGRNPNKKTVALRADFDALPITELNEVPYKSKNIGVMHACGHDVHTASLLGVARILNEVKDEFEGTIKLIFQPAEEKAPGGASLMIKEGVLKNPDVISIIGQHVAPNIPVGKIGFREGMYMASTDELYIKIIGKGGHGAAPHQTIDPILVASHIVIALQQIISRNRNPTYPSVLTFGKFVGGTATNIIPDEVNIEGTYRCMNEEWRAEGLIKMKKMAEGIAEAMGGICEFNIIKGYPFLQNNPELTKRMRLAAETYMGSENVINLDLWMAGEDFAFYSQQIDACFYRLGTRNEAKGIVSGVHTPTFDIDENALNHGPGLMAYLAICELGE